MGGNSTETEHETVRCPVCGEERSESAMVPGELIRREHPEFPRL